METRVIFTLVASLLHNCFVKAAISPYLIFIIYPNSVITITVRRVPAVLLHDGHYQGPVEREGTFSYKLFSTTTYPKDSMINGLENIKIGLYLEHIILKRPTQYSFFIGIKFRSM